MDTISSFFHFLIIKLLALHISITIYYSAKSAQHLEFYNLTHRLKERGETVGLVLAVVVLEGLAFHFSRHPLLLSVFKAKSHTVCHENDNERFQISNNQPCNFLFRM